MERKIKEYGGVIQKKAKVNRLVLKDGLVSEAIVNDDYIVRGKLFISNIHPKETLKFLNDEGLRKSYVKRIKALKNTISSFTLNIVLKKKTLEYKDYNIYRFNSDESGPPLIIKNQTGERTLPCSFREIVSFPIIASPCR